jgi:5-(carboxyamino)imidazole ribonucleotide mutase
MPAGVPVATVGIGNAKNAGILAARILATSDMKINSIIEDKMKELNLDAKAKGAALKAKRSQKTGF